MRFSTSGAATVTASGRLKMTQNRKKIAARAYQRALKTAQRQGLRQGCVTPLTPGAAGPAPAAISSPRARRQPRRRHPLADQHQPAHRTDRPTIGGHPANVHRARIRRGDTNTAPEYPGAGQTAEPVRIASRRCTWTRQSGRSLTAASTATPPPPSALVGRPVRPSVAPGTVRVERNALRNGARA